MNFETPPEQFYSELGEEYDAMTRFEQRLGKQKGTMAPWVNEFSLNRVLDAGCGSGVLAIALAQLRLNVTAVDLSATMLAQAEKHAARHGQDVRFVQSELAEIANHVSDKFDAVFCLGNTLPHIQDEHQLFKTVAGFKNVLKAGGIVVLELLNYTKVLKEKERLVGINEVAQKIFVRFYDFIDDRLRFNILRLSQDGDDLRHKWFSTTLYPWRHTQLEAVLTQAGFEQIAFYGSLAREPFASAASKNLIVLAQ